MSETLIGDSWHRVSLPDHGACFLPNLGSHHYLSTGHTTQSYCSIKPTKLQLKLNVWNVTILFWTVAMEQIIEARQSQAPGCCQGPWHGVLCRLGLTRLMGLRDRQAYAGTTSDATGLAQAPK